MAFTGRSFPFTYKHTFQSVLANHWLEHILNDLQRQVKEGCVFVGLKPTAVTTFIKLSQRCVFARSAHPRTALCPSLSGSFITLMFHVLSLWTSWEYSVKVCPWNLGRNVYQDWEDQFSDLCFLSPGNECSSVMLDETVNYLGSNSINYDGVFSWFNGT
jgi:hypothetical protein